MEGTIKVRGRDVSAAAMLAALHNNTAAQGMGMFHDIGRRITRAEAAEHLAKVPAFAFDYFLGRPLKCHAWDGELTPDSERLYDRDAGRGAFDRAFAEALADER